MNNERVRAIVARLREKQNAREVSGGCLILSEDASWPAILAFIKEWINLTPDENDIVSCVGYPKIVRDPRYGVTTMVSPCVECPLQMENVKRKKNKERNTRVLNFLNSIKFRK